MLALLTAPSTGSSEFVSQPQSPAQPPVALQDHLLSLPGTLSGDWHDRAPELPLFAHGPVDSMPASWQQPAAVSRYPPAFAPSDIQPSLASSLLDPHQPAQLQVNTLESMLPGSQPALQPHAPGFDVAGPSALPPPDARTYAEGFAAGLKAAQAQAAAAHQPANQPWQQDEYLASHGVDMQALSTSQADIPLPPVQLPWEMAGAGEDGALDELLSLLGVAS